jgi:hypothetical protein
MTPLLQDLFQHVCPNGWNMERDIYASNGVNRAALAAFGLSPDQELCLAKDLLVEML